MKITPESHFRKHMINYCIEVIKEEMKKARSERTRGRTIHHLHVLSYAVFHRKATAQKLLKKMNETPKRQD